MKNILFFALLLSQICLSTNLLAETLTEQGTQSISQDVNQDINIVQHLNINTASVAELTVLPGIGVKKAQAIVAYRTDHGEFLKKEDLTEVKGISHKLLAKIESRIRVQ